MKKNAMVKMLSGIQRGRTVDEKQLGLGKEEFVSLVSQAIESGYIEGVYVSFCDSQSSEGLLSSARITDKGQQFLKKKQGFFSGLRMGR